MTSDAAQYTERRRAFRQLHESGCFVIPNPWDAGSARYLQQLGFKALATTSAGCAWTNGAPDGGADSTPHGQRQAIVAATDLPVNADFEAGFAARQGRGRTRHGVRERQRGRPLDRTAPASATTCGARGAGAPDGRAPPSTSRTALLVGRAGATWWGPDRSANIRQLTAYANASADVLFAPSVTAARTSPPSSRRSPRVINVVMSRPTGLTVADLAGLGVRRISVGALARVAWTAFTRPRRPSPATACSPDSRALSGRRSADL
jgi:2-methylisocitrate lyase-like PEP mutase family enzyme